MSQTADHPGLGDKNLVGHRRLICMGKGRVLHLFFFHKSIVIHFKNVLFDLDILRRHFNQFLIIKWNPKPLRQLAANLPPTASKLPADGNDFCHKAPPKSHSSAVKHCNPLHLIVYRIQCSSYTMSSAHSIPCPPPFWQC